ncbi:IclR family transcriptional regulator [Massilia niastensis]|uniref:IclR family transcriptional regulator n=1 Tax=Massilia niastensis TaxID=544911 RepID=UPI00035E8287|nr:IclR family transcriptional regulator C-terminal domain-containing protein [Massilia niastensis]
MKLEKVALTADDSAPPLSSEPKSAERENSASSSSKILNILDLFNIDRTTLHVQDVAALFGVSQSTAYRYLKELSSAGFLAQLGKGNYSLGPKIVELERLLRLTDPLFVAGTLAMSNLQQYCANRALLLCTLYNDRVLCIYKTGADAIRTDSESMPILRDRGTPFPLFQGAGSQAILAHLPAHTIKSLYLSSQEAIADARLGSTWKEFRDKLSQIRKNGYAMHTGKINTKMLGVAVPIVLQSGEVTGSLLMLTQNTSEEIDELGNIVPQLQAQATAISKHIVVLQEAQAARNP